MKKLIATLFMMTLGFSLVAVAGPVYKFEEVDNYNAFPILGVTNPVQYNGNYHYVETDKIKPGSSNPSDPSASYIRRIQKTPGEEYLVYEPVSTLNYHVSGKINRNFNGQSTAWDLGHVSFSTNENLYLGVWPDIDNEATNERRRDVTLGISDYGIYLLDEDIDGIHNWRSTLNEAVEVEAGKKFGVYYYDEVTEKYYTSTDNWLASYDNTNKETNGTHIIADNAWITDAWFKEGDGVITRTPFFLLEQGPFTADQHASLEWQHFEFGFVMGEAPSGQPLPGTLATLLIGGLCAKALRKRNKK